MMAIKPCPKCGQPMAEERKCPGLWMCPDYKERLNEAPPFRFKCTGMELTDEGAAEIQREIENIIAGSN